MKKISVGILVLTTPLLALAVTDAEVDALLTESSKNLQKRLPITLSDMDFVRVHSLPGKKFVYFMVVHSGITPTAEAKAAQRIQSINQYCTDPSSTFRDLGVTVEHRYFAADGRFIFATSTTTKDCRRGK